MKRGGTQAFFESPHAAAYILILLNAAMFSLTLIGGSLARIAPVTFFLNGALYQDALTRKEYWCLVTYAFLHANVLHLALNLACIGSGSPG